MAREAQEIANYFRDLCFFAVRSGEFRILLADFIDFMQSMMRSAKERVSRLTEAAKSDYNRGDTSLTATSEEGKALAREAKEKVESR
jgi:hypothetical protein